jgi:hypothetical protein
MVKKISKNESIKKAKRNALDRRIVVAHPENRFFCPFRRSEIVRLEPGASRSVSSGHMVRSVLLLIVLFASSHIAVSVVV